MTTVLPPLQRVAHRPAANLPQTALGALFTVSGGPVWAIGIGRVTTVLGASASLVKLVADPTVGADSDLSLAAGTSLTGVAVNVWVGNGFLAVQALGTSLGGDAPAITGGGSILISQIGVAIAPGSISLNTTGNQTGQMEWFCWWVPMVPGARVDPA